MIHNTAQKTNAPTPAIQDETIRESTPSKVDGLGGRCYSKDDGRSGRKKRQKKASRMNSAGGAIS
jgi:hypothetical protein